MRNLSYRGAFVGCSSCCQPTPTISPVAAPRALRTLKLHHNLLHRNEILAADNRERFAAAGLKVTARRIGVVGVSLNKFFGFMSSFSKDSFDCFFRKFLFDGFL